MTYPHSPGFAKGSATSHAAATKVAPRVKALHLTILRLLVVHTLGIDEIATKLSRHILTVRPRISEMVELGFVDVTKGVTTSQLGNPQSLVAITNVGRSKLAEIDAPQDRANVLHAPTMPQPAEQVPQHSLDLFPS